MTGLRPAFPLEASLRTYASRDNAVKAFAKACEKIGVAEMTYLIAVAENGRFYPVALPSEAQLQSAIALMHTSNVCIFRH